MNDITVRRAVAGDGAAIARIQVATWRAAYRDLMPASLLDALDETTKAVSWERMLAEAASPTFLAILAGEAVGFVVACKSRDSDADAGAGEIAALYVLPAHSRHGVGARLMEAGLAQIASWGCADSILWVFEDNAPARAFYGRLGFIDDGARKTHERSGLVEMRMRRN